MMTIQEELFGMQDLVYRDFHSKLTPTVSREQMIGVRTPQLRSLAKRMHKEGSAEEFLRSLPHHYYEENQLHGFLISEMKEYDKALSEIERFLPYIDNWATCDQTSPKVFGKHTEELLPSIKRWLDSGETYTIRFGIGMLMSHYLKEKFQPEYLEMVSRIQSEEYYVNMMAAWYFATALAFQYESTVVYLEEKRLDTWVHNKTIQKARESNRITAEQKEYLKTLKE